MARNKLVLYRPSWQRLRVSCIANNNAYNGFTTLAGTQDNCARLENYVNDARPHSLAEYTKTENDAMKLTAEEELASRVYRVYNLLTATRMGYSGMHLTGSDLDRVVVQFRDSLVDDYSAGLVDKAAAKWNWDVAQYELETMWREDNYWFEAIYRDLGRRVYVAARKRRRDTGGVNDTDQTRAELLRFVGMMDAIKGRY